MPRVRFEPAILHFAAKTIIHSSAVAYCDILILWIVMFLLCIALYCYMSISMLVCDLTIFINYVYLIVGWLLCESGQLINLDWSLAANISYIYSD